MAISKIRNFFENKPYDQTKKMTFLYEVITLHIG